MTAQAHEKLIIDGQENSMAYCPPLPSDDPKIEHTPTGLWSSFCWRGYFGTWEIADGKFYLKGLSGSFRLIGGKAHFQCLIYLCVSTCKVKII